MKKMGTFLFFAGVAGLAVFALMGCGKAPSGTGAEGAAATAASATALSPDSSATGTRFGYPAGGEPWYFVKGAFVMPEIPAGLEAAAWSVDRVDVDGVRARDFLVYQGGREVDKLGVKAAGGKLAFEVKARHVWRPEAATEMKVQLVEPKSGDIRILTSSGKAPAGKGYWDPAWKSYMALVVSEDHGFARTGYPVHATIGILAGYMRSPDEVRVVRAERSGRDVIYREVPSQVYDVVTWNDPKILAAYPPADITVERIGDLSDYDLATLLRAA